MDIRRSRRAVLQGGIAAAGLGLVPGCASAQGRRPSPSDRVNVAAIGAGGQGSSNMSALTSQNIVAICDADYGRVDRSLRDRDGAIRPEREALKAAYDATERHTDYRRMFDARKDIEAVVIATPDHHHALAAKMAMERGLHVFVQKPLTYTVRESRMLQAMAKANPKLVTQMGNQGHSGDDGRRVVELIRGGVIGKVKEVHVWTNRPVWPQGVPLPEPRPVPATLDWDVWRGPATVDWGYHPDYCHFNWRGWTPFGTGALGDMGAHLLDFPVWALQPGLPTRIETRHTLWGGDTDPWDSKRPEQLTSYPLAAVTHYEFGNAPGGPLSITWYDGGLMPPTPPQLPPGLKMEPGGGVMFVGEGGLLLHETYGEKPVLVGEGLDAKAAAIPQSLPRIAGGMRGHEMNWIRAIRGQEPISNPFEASAPLNETMVLGVVAMLAEEPILYDGAAGRITNVESANRHLDREYREGWAI
ncbi:gfo/Idh/MocA family oxidoreductase [bacterium]|nr:gfo/Idh/MocA family oxidoreductase [bacterium]